MQLARKALKRFVSVLRGPDHIFEFVNAAHRQTFGDRSLLGQARADVFPELNRQGFSSAPRRAFRSAKPVFMRDKSANFDARGNQQEMKLCLDISYEPMRDAQGNVTGLFVQGRDVTSARADPLETLARHAGLAALSDEELLALLLYHGTLDADSHEHAAYLLHRFHDLSRVFAASVPALTQLVPFNQCSTANSLSTSAALHLKIIREIGRRILMGKLASRPVIASHYALHSYVKNLLSPHPRECFVVLFLDDTLSLIACETLWEGTVNDVSVHSREVLRRALELSASAMILVRNHPAGSTNVSAKDIARTKAIQRGAETLDMKVLDHLVVAGNELVSLASKGLLP